MGQESTDLWTGSSTYKDETDETESVAVYLNRIATAVAADNPQMIFRTCIASESKHAKQNSCKHLNRSFC